MPRADFYALQDTHLEARYRLLHPLLTKTLQHQQQVHIHCRDAAEVKHLDGLLWEVKLTAFLPHHRLDVQDEPYYSPITLGYDSHWPGHKQMCINFTHVPVFDFARVIQVIVQQPDLLQQARQAYKAYQTHGFEVHHHPIGA